MTVRGARQTLFLLACWVCTSSPAVADHHASPLERAMLDTRGSFNITWHYNDDVITFEVTARTTGWLAIGFSPNGDMINSDMAVVEHLEAANPVITDRHTGPDRTIPTVDIIQDWTLISSSSNDGVYTVVLSRALKPCNQPEDINIGSDTMRVLYAYGDSAEISKHTQISRGSRSLYLLSASEFKSQTIPDDAIHHDFLMNTTIPDHHTTYWCTLQRMPELKSKHHIISYEPLIQAGNEPYVHHILVYGCYHDIDGDSYIETNNHSHECFGPNMPPDILKCRTSLFGWAVGGGRFDFPPEAGFALGAGEKLEYIALEVHYDNPYGASGVHDMSGMRMTITPTLREFDADFISIGMVDSIVVPPNVPKMDVNYFCPSQCTQETLPPEGVTVIAGLLHSHLLGRKLSLRHFRGEMELPPIIVDHTYDFNYQETRHITGNVKILPGDTLQMTCTMESLANNETTYGGLSTREEMCIAFITTYPRIPLPFCGSFPAFHSKPDESELYKQLGVSDGITANSKTMSKNFESVEWTPEHVQALERAYLTDKHYGICLNAGQKPYESTMEEVTIPSRAHHKLTLADECEMMESGEPGLIFSSYLLACGMCAYYFLS